MQSTKSKQRGGNCGAGMCSLQMGGRRTRTKSRSVRRTRKQSGRGCGCQGANSVRGPQMGGKKSRKSKKRGGAIASGSEVSLRKK
jgi:hypothetical protein